MSQVMGGGVYDLQIFGYHFIIKIPVLYAETLKVVITAQA